MWLRTRMMIQALHLRGDAYTVYTRETFLAIAQANDGFLKAQFGFTSADFLHAVEHAENSIESALNAQFQGTMGMFDSLIRESADSIHGKKFTSLEMIGKFLRRPRHFGRTTARAWISGGTKLTASATRPYSG